MFGTVARIKIKPGMDEAITKLGATWARDEYERSGQLAEMIFKLENSPDEYIIVAAFPDREAYFANAEHPNTHRNYERLRELLVADPEWNDGEIVDMLGSGGI
jgi:quinol monooxygenase YgiN